MMDPQVLWIWLQMVLGSCNAKFKDILAEYDTVENFYERRETAPVAGLLTPAEYKNARSLTLDGAKAIQKKCNANGIRMLCYNDEAYPARLRETHFPPIVLYVTGDADALNTPLAVAGIGSRFSTKYGRDAVHYICDPLAKAGITLVSGLANGIDSEVHRSALDNGAKTVAVLGTAIGDTYPKQNLALRKQIEQQGAVVSEYPPGSPNHPGMFPQRNRIISGISKTVVIFEAAKKSGTMITANWALDDGKDVFAVPGSILSSNSEGTNLLIKHGAIPLLSPIDLFDALDLRDYQLLQKPAPAEPVSEQGAVILKILRRDGALTIDDLAAKCGLLPHVLLSEITSLEIDGHIEALSGARYEAR